MSKYWLVEYPSRLTPRATTEQRPPNIVPLTVYKSQIIKQPFRTLRPKVDHLPIGVILDGRIPIKTKYQNNLVFRNDVFYTLRLHQNCLIRLPGFGNKKIKKSQQR